MLAFLVVHVCHLFSSLNVETPDLMHLFHSQLSNLAALKWPKVHSVPPKALLRFCAGRFDEKPLGLPDNWGGS